MQCKEMVTDVQGLGQEWMCAVCNSQGMVKYGAQENDVQ